MSGPRAAGLGESTTNTTRERNKEEVGNGIKEVLLRENTVYI